MKKSRRKNLNELAEECLYATHGQIISGDGVKAGPAWHGRRGLNLGSWQGKNPFLRPSLMPHST